MSKSVLGPTVDATDVWFRLRLPADGIRAVHLWQEVARPRIGPALHRDSEVGVWQCRLPRPPVDRMEYQYQVDYADSSLRYILDPHNNRTAPGPFGDKSVLELPGYRPPAWVDADDGDEGRCVQISIDSDVLDARLPVNLWDAPGLDVEREAPLLIAHDGPQLAGYSQLLRFLSVMVRAERLPPMRVALLPPIDRNEHYAACPSYARALAREIVPVLDWLAPQPPPRYDGRSWRIGLGVSLGALAMLHAHRRYPTLFGGLFLQSGSFFQRHIDTMETGFSRFDRITRFVSTVCEVMTARKPIPVGMTCGTVEENLANNWRMHDALALQGYDVTLVEQRDAHNWIAWRDAFDPHLTLLLRRCWT